MPYYDIHNPTKKTRIIPDINNRPVSLRPGLHYQRVPLSEQMAEMLKARENDLILTDPSPEATPPVQPRPGAFTGAVPQTPIEPSPALPEDSRVALVIGGAECAMDDYVRAKSLCDAVGYAVFATNDYIEKFAEPVDYAVTLHPDKLNNWLTARDKAGYEAPKQIWLHRPHKGLPAYPTTKDWGGSVGLFAVKLARERGFSRIILCGVPMTVEGKHFLRHKNWDAVWGFRKAWDVHRNEIAPYVRSFSGWTAQLLGGVTEAFIPRNAEIQNSLGESAAAPTAGRVAASEE